MVAYAPTDPALIPAAGDTLLQEEIDGPAWLETIAFLRKAADPKALEFLRKADQLDLRPEYDEGRVALAAALASYNDFRRLPDALEILAGLVDPWTEPDDYHQRWQRERSREQQIKQITDALAATCTSPFGQEPPDEVVRMLTGRLKSGDPRTLSAVLTVLEALPTIPHQVESSLEPLLNHENDDLAGRARKLLADRP